jgi:hypothetical protein
LILLRQTEQRRERRKCLDADIRLSCQKPGVRVCRPVEHPCRHFKPPICLRLFQRAAEDDKTTLVDCPMNANSATKPRMMPIKNLAKNGPVGVLKPRCTIPADSTPRSAISAPRNTRIATPSELSKPPPKTVHHQGRTPQSMSALPGYFRHQLVPLLPGRHRPRGLLGVHSRCGLHTRAVTNS